MKRRILLGLTVVACAGLSLAATPPMPEAKIFARLTSAGEALGGNVSVSSYGALDVSHDTIELLGFSWEAAAAKGGGGEPVYAPIRFKKWVDQSSPRFAQALVEGSAISGQFFFFDQDPEGGGARHFYSVEIHDARVVKVGNAMAAAETAVEEVQLELGTITVQHEIHGTLFSDSVNGK